MTTSMTTSRARVETGASAGDELREAALAAVLRLLLVEERELVALEPLEELVPRDLLERLLAAPARVVDPEDPRVVALPGRLHARGAPAALLDPAPDLVVVRR